MDLNDSGHALLSAARDVLAWTLGRRDTVFHLQLRIINEILDEHSLRMVRRGDGWHLEMKPAAPARKPADRENQRLLREG